MSKVAYTILFEMRPRSAVNVTVPALPGFQFKAATYKAALYQAPNRLGSYLKTLKKSGKAIPKESKSFRIDKLIIEVNAPRA